MTSSDYKSKKSVDFFIYSSLDTLFGTVSELDKKEVSAQIILNRYLGKEQSDRHTLMEVFRAHNEKCRALIGINFAPDTVLRYETCLRLIEEFMRNTYKKEDCYLEEVTKQFVEEFESLLSGEI